MDDSTMDAEVEAWAGRQSAAEREDPIWTLFAYRLSRFALDQTRDDLKGAGKGISFRTKDQLLRAVTSISANIGEGYARAGVAERRRFYTFALGSSREAISWYASLVGTLPGGVPDARISVLTRVRRLLLGLIRSGGPSGWRKREPK